MRQEVVCVGVAEEEQGNAEERKGRTNGRKRRKIQVREGGEMYRGEKKKLGEMVIEGKEKILVQTYGKIMYKEEKLIVKSRRSSKYVRIIYNAVSRSCE